jgi:putative oxidoreductase
MATKLAQETPLSMPVPSARVVSRLDGTLIGNQVIAPLSAEHGQMTRSPVWALRALRIVVAALIFIHGATRLLSGGVTSLGDFLVSAHVPFGHVVAWALTIVEVFATPLLALGLFTTRLAVFFAVELAVGIALVHLRSGWFVVGGGTNGMEYSVLLIAVLLAVAWGSSDA